MRCLCWEKGGGKTNWKPKLEILWQRSIRCPEYIVERVLLPPCSALTGAVIIQCNHGIDSRLSRTGPGRTYQDVAGALECWIFSVLILLEKRGNAEQALPPTVAGNWKTQISARPSVQTGNAPSKVKYVLCLLIAEYSPGSSDHLPCAVPSDYSSGTWIFTHGDSYHHTTEEDIFPVDHCEPRGIQPSWCGLHFHSYPTQIEHSPL